MTSQEAIETIEANYPSEKYSMLREALDMVLAMLKEQETVEPDTDSEGTCSCGNCGETVGCFPAGCSTPLKFYKFCPMCGRQVKWNG